MTPRQREAFDFIRDRLGETGVTPTLSEIGEHMGLANRSNVHAIVQALIREGYLIRSHARGAHRQLRLPGIDVSRATSQALLAELNRRGIEVQYAG